MTAPARAVQAVSPGVGTRSRWASARQTAAEAARRFQNQLLPLTVARASRQSRFYGEYFGSSAARVRSVDDLHHLPILSKETVVANHSRLLTSREVPALVQHTTGTTGEPLAIYRSRAELDFIRAFFLALVEPRPASPAPIVLHLADLYHGAALEIPSHQYPLVGGVTDDILMRQTVHLLMQSYTIPGVAKRVSAVVGLVPYLKTLTEYLIEQKFDFDRVAVKTIVPLCTIVTPRWRRLLSSTWGAQVVDRYSLSEIFGGATLCPACGHYHFDTYVVPEVVDPVSGAPLSRGIGVMVLTSLYPFVQLQPMIRYRTDDLAEIRDDGCEGRFSVRFAGRDSNAIRIAKGQELFITPVDLYEVLDEYPDINCSDRFIDVRAVADHRAAGALRFEVRCTGEGDDSVVIRLELRYSPHLYPNRLEELRASILSRLAERSSSVARLIAERPPRIALEFVAPGLLPPFALKV